MRVRYSARTHVGRRREINQDSHGASEGEYGTLLVVCDGMGGHAAGEIASRIAVETIVAQFSATSPPPVALNSAFSSANAQIYGEGRGSMGTTGVAALLQSNTLYIANVGDSRAYLVREGRIQQLSRDHSFVSDQVAAGLMTAEQARHSNIRNIITRALGHQPEVEVDLFTRGLRAGDTILLSSDGMHGLIEDAEIAEITSMLTPEQAVERLVDTANERGGTDNITVVIAQVDELDPALPGAPPDTEELPELGPLAATAPPAPAPVAPERPLSRLGLALAGALLLLLLGLGGYTWFNSVVGGAALPTSTALAPPSSPAPVRTTVVTVVPSPSLAPSSLASPVTTAAIIVASPAATLAPSPLPSATP